MHERANCRSKFSEQTRPFRLRAGESADIIRLISEEVVRGVGKEDGELKKTLRQPVVPIYPATRVDGKYIIAITPFNPIQYAGDVIERRAPYAEFGQIISVNLFRDDLLWAAYNVNINWHCKLNRGNNNYLIYARSSEGCLIASIRIHKHRGIIRYENSQRYRLESYKSTGRYRAEAIGGNARAAKRNNNETFIHEIIYGEIMHGFRDHCEAHP